MSIKIMSLVWDADLPPMEKLVLLALADCANDEGRCWPSALTLARKSGQCERTVRKCIRTLIEKSHLSEEQRSGTSTLFTVHPCTGCTPAQDAPLHDAQDTPASRAPTPASRAPKPSKKHQGTVIPLKRAIPDDWEPREFSDGTQSRKVTDGWPPGEREAQLEQFKAHHRAKGTRCADPQDYWQTWVLNTRKFGIGRYDRTIGKSAAAYASLVANLDPDETF